METTTSENETSRRIANIEADFAAINEALANLGATVKVTPVMRMAVSAFESEPGAVSLVPRQWFEPYAWWAKRGDAVEVVRMFFFSEPHKLASKAFVDACERASVAIAGRHLTPAEVVSLVRHELEYPPPMA